MGTTTPQSSQSRSSIASLAVKLRARFKRRLRQVALIDFDHGADAAVVRAQKLKEIVSLTPWMMIGALINGAILVTHFWGAPNTLLLAGWGVILAFVYLTTLYKWARSRNRPTKPRASKHALVRAIRHATLLGAIWGALPFLVFGQGNDSDQALVVITLVGMSASGAFALAVVPPAAVAHLMAIMLPSLIGLVLSKNLVSFALCALLINYFIILNVIILARNREFAHRIRSRFEMEKQGETISVLLKDFQSSSSDWLWETDSDGRLVYVAKRLVDVTGLPAANLKNVCVSKTGGDKADSHEWRKLLAHIRNGEPVHDFTVPAFVRSAEAWWSFTGRAITDDDGTVTGYRGVGSDISARVKAQSLLKEQNAVLTSFNTRLEEQVTQRTAEAKAAVEEARQASQVKSAFLANMSHEIRTPMNGVLGMADLLTRTELSAHQRRLVDTIDQSAQTLLTIINDILDLSRIESGKLDIDAQEFEFRPCIENAVELLAEDAFKKDLELNLFVPNSVPAFLVGDAGRLRQVLVNLIGNAVKFTNSGEVTVRVDHLGVSDGKSTVRFSVIDTGIGIDAATQERLFKPFSQADSSIRRRFGGTGLGLSITRNLVEMMGGSVVLTSTLGEGTTISFEISLDVGQSSHAAPSNVQTDIAGRRVLVVDDRATNREIICSYLADCGAETVTAASAEEALVALRAGRDDSQPFDVAILDMIMPGINGLELARLIVADDSLADIKLLMVTSLSWKGDSRAARDVGMDAFLSKPIRRKELIDTVTRALSTSSDRSRVPAKAAKTQQDTADIFKGLRLLVAEDNLVNQEVARAYAASLGCICTVADNGQLALDAFAEQHFDLVLMDCQMPEMDGLTACVEMRKLETLRDRCRTPIIAVTANAYDSDREICLAAGMDDFMGKPFTERQLATMLEKWWTPADETQSPAAALLAAPSRTGDAAAVIPGQAMDETEPTFDARVLEVFDEHRKGSAQKLASIFLQTVPSLVQKIMMGIVDDNHDDIRGAAHALKSAAGNVGAVRLQSIVTKIETLARSKTEMASVLPVAVRLQAEMSRVEAAISDAAFMSDKTSKSA